MASTELRHRVEKVVAYPPLSELSDLQRRDFHEALLEAVSFEDLPGRWQAAFLAVEQNRPRCESSVAIDARHGGLCSSDSPVERPLVRLRRQGLQKP